MKWYGIIHKKNKKESDMAWIYVSNNLLFFYLWHLYYLIFLIIYVLSSINHVNRRISRFKCHEPIQFFILYLMSSGKEMIQKWSGKLVISPCYFMSWNQFQSGQNFNFGCRFLRQKIKFQVIVILIFWYYLTKKKK